jgi:hypothetical protein
MEKTEIEKVHEMLAKDPHCRKVSEPDGTQVTLLPKAALAVVKAAIKP